MNFDDLKDQLISQSRQAWEKFQESSLYNQARDRFENLSPLGQKLSLIGFSVSIVMIFLSIPWGSYSNASGHVDEFVASRNLIRDLFKVNRESQESPQLISAPSAQSLKTQIEATLISFQLLPEQLKGVELINEKSQLIPDNLMQGQIQVQLAKLNLRQITDIGYQLQSQNPSVKVKDMSIEINSQNPKYFDVTYKLAALKIPEPPPLLPPDSETKTPNRKNSEKSKDGDE